MSEVYGPAAKTRDEIINQIKITSASLSDPSSTTGDVNKKNFLDYSTRLKWDFKLSSPKVSHKIPDRFMTFDEIRQFLSPISKELMIRNMIDMSKSKLKYASDFDYNDDRQTMTMVENMRSDLKLDRSKIRYVKPVLFGPSDSILKNLGEANGSMTDKVFVDLRTPEKQKSCIPIFVESDSSSFSLNLPFSYLTSFFSTNYMKSKVFDIPSTKSVCFKASSSASKTTDISILTLSSRYFYAMSLRGTVSRPLALTIVVEYFIKDLFYSEKLGRKKFSVLDQIIANTTIKLAEAILYDGLYSPKFHKDKMLEIVSFLDIIQINYKALPIFVFRLYHTTMAKMPEAKHFNEKISYYVSDIMHFESIVPNSFNYPRPSATTKHSYVPIVREAVISHDCTDNISFSLLGRMNFIDKLSAVDFNKNYCKGLKKLINDDRKSLRWEKLIERSHIECLDDYELRTSLLCQIKEEHIVPGFRSTPYIGRVRTIDIFSLFQFTKDITISPMDHLTPDERSYLTDKNRNMKLNLEEGKVKKRIQHDSIVQLFTRKGKDCEIEIPQVSFQIYKGTESYQERIPSQMNHQVPLLAFTPNLKSNVFDPRQTKLVKNLILNQLDIYPHKIGKNCQTGVYITIVKPFVLPSP